MKFNTPEVIVVATIMIQFSFDLADPARKDEPGGDGLLVQGWQPTKETSYITLDTGDPTAKLLVWIETEGEEATASWTVSRGGPLRGMLTMDEDDEQTLIALTGGTGTTKEYSTLGKKVVGLIYEPVSKLIKILRVTYGQYWVRVLPEWDSRQESLGSYCAMLNMTYSMDEGATWISFQPDGTRVTITINGSRPTHDFLKRSEWDTLREAAQSGFEPSLAAELLLRAHQLLEEGNFRSSLVEAVSALEVAMDQFLSVGITKNESAAQKNGAKPTKANLRDLLKQFGTFSLPVRTAAIALCIGTVPQDQIELAVSAVQTRNDVVHKGHVATDAVKSELQALLSLVSALLPGPRVKFPGMRTGWLALLAHAYNNQKRLDSAF